MDDFNSALKKWKKVGSDYDPTFYAHENDKTTLYALIDPPIAQIAQIAQIENCLPSAKTLNPKVFFIKKSDISLLQNVNNFPNDITYLDVFRGEHKEMWSSVRPGKQKQLGWRALFDAATASKLKQASSNNILLQRSTSPNYRFWIRLPSPHGDMNGEVREKSVTFGNLPNIQDWAKTAVPDAVDQVKNKTGEWMPPTKKPQDPNKYILLSRNPFHLFETWIHEDDLRLHLSSFPDESFPDEAKVGSAQKLLHDNLQAKGYFFTDEQKTKTHKKISAIEEEATDNSAAHPDGEILWTRLSTDTMQQPHSKSTRPWDQATTMGGTSAPDFAKKLGWRGAAEWLHLSGYAWGGLASMFEPDSKATKATKATLASSQQPLNFCIGTPECNTHMLRWEKAWQNLFHKEKSLSGIAVEGGLLVCNNEHIMVAPPRRPADPHYPRENAPIIFDEYGLGNNNNDWSLARAWRELGCLVFVMEYEVTLEGVSKILGGVQGPKSEVQFHPFRRQLTTKTECLLDDILFGKLLARQK